MRVKKCKGVKMKNTIKLIGIAVFIAAIVFSFTACEDLLKALADTGITYTVTQVGGSSTADSTGIRFTFSESIDGMGVTAANITVSGAAAKGTATFTRTSGTVWTLSPITVNTSGKATVTIDKDGITPVSRDVSVIKKADATYTVEQIGGSSTADTTGIRLTFNQSIVGMGVTVADISVSGAAAKGTATFTRTSDTVWTLSPITVNSTGNATVTINKTGISSTSRTVAVFKAPAGSLFNGTWEVKNDEDEVSSIFTFSNGNYTTADKDGVAILRGTYTTTGTTSGNYTLTPTEINGAYIKGMFDFENLFTPKLEAKWYTAEEYAALVMGHIEGLEVLLEAEKAERYAEIDADDTKTEEEKATAKEWVDFELGLKYGFVEVFLPAMTLLLLSPTPDINEDPALNGTATYALTNSNQTLTFTVVTKEKDSETGVITSKTSITTLRKK
jgi:hypothetical protein